ncbi:MAG: hypothetical protein VZT48_11440 [Bulleidia sp.]|nr:hypothetical protein [Bulleidia sp.]
MNTSAVNLLALKKTGIILAAAASMVLGACGSSSTAASTEAAAETTAAEEVQTVGQYTFYNGTGETVTEFYLYPTGSSDKGENLAGDHGFNTDHAIYTTYDAGDKAADTALTVEFTTASGYTGTFETLHIETAPITLIAEDAKTGATEIAFGDLGVTVRIVNATGEEVTDLYLYPTGSSDKGENLIDGAKEDGGKQDITFDKVPEGLISDAGVGHFTVEFTTASGYTGTWDHLSYENVELDLIPEDEKTGATGVKPMPLTD